MKNNRLTYKIERDGAEFHAFVPELPGCHTHGKTVTEAMSNLKDAVQLYISVQLEEELQDK